MQIAGFNGIGGFRRNKGPRAAPSFSVSLTGLTSGAAGDTTTLGFAISVGTVDAQRWQTSPSGGVWSDIAGATSISEIVDFASGRHVEGMLIRVGVTSQAVEVFSSPAVMTFAPPLVVQPAVDLSFNKDTGVQFYNISPVFSGDGMSYAISSAIGVSIDSASGIIALDTDAMVVQNDTVLTITASNSGGTATISQTITIGQSDTFAVTSIAGQPVIVVNDGALTVTLADGPYVGTYATDINGATITVDQLETGPMALVRPVVNGTTAPGDTLGILAGLWLYSATSPGDPVYQWLRDGVPISGATAATYTLVAADSGAQISVTETFGGVEIQSDALAIPTVASFMPSDLAELVDDFNADAVPSTLSQDSGLVSAWGNSASGANSFDALSAALSPQTGAAVQNGRETVSFDGSHYMVDASAAAFSPSGTLMIAFKANTTDNAFDSIYSVFDAGMSFQIDSNATTGGEFHGRVNSKAHTSLERAVSSGNAWMILAYRWDIATGRASLWTNGVMNDEATDYLVAYPSAPGRIVLGANRGRNIMLACDVGQVWRFDGAITDAELSDMFTYASTRWNIALDT